MVGRDGGMLGMWLVGVVSGRGVLGMWLVGVVEEDVMWGSWGRWV